MAKETRRERQSKEMSHAVISTFAGVTRLPLGTKVWTKTPDGAVEKLVSDLEPGDKVLERNTRIRLSLDDIKSALLKGSVAYRAAHAQLYHVPAEGEPTYKFREFLLSSLEHHGIDRNRLEERGGLKQAVDLIHRRLMAAERVAGNLKIAGVDIARSKSQIARWLHGEVALPENPLTLRLLHGLHPAGFAKFFGNRSNVVPREKRADSALYYAHDHWKISHSTLTNWIGGFSEKALESGKDSFEMPTEEETRRKDEKSARGDAKKLRELADQRRLIYSELINPIYEQVDTQHAFVAVKHIAPITRREHDDQTGAEGRQAPSMMPKGVLLSHKVDPQKTLGVPVRSVSEILKEQVVLMAILAKAFRGIPVLHPNGEPEAGLGKIVLEAITNLDILRRGSQPYIPHSYQSGPGTIRHINLRREEDIRVGEEALSQILTGRLDEENGFEKGTLLKVLQRERELYRSIPVMDSVIHYSRILNRIRGRVNDAIVKKNRAELRALKHELEAPFKRIRQYGLGVDGVVVPSQANIRTPAEYRQFLEGRRLWYSQLGFPSDAKLSEAPPTEKEVRSIAGNISADKRTSEKLLGLYGRENFIELG